MSLQSTWIPLLIGAFLVPAVHAAQRTAPELTPDELSRALDQTVLTSKAYRTVEEWLDSPLWRSRLGAETVAFIRAGIGARKPAMIDATRVGNELHIPNPVVALPLRLETISQGRFALGDAPVAIDGMSFAVLYERVLDAYPSFIQNPAGARVPIPKGKRGEALWMPAAQVAFVVAIFLAERQAIALSKGQVACEGALASPAADRLAAFELLRSVQAFKAWRSRNGLNLAPDAENTRRFDDCLTRLQARFDSLPQR
jgi:hypothetical protein